MLHMTGPQSARTGQGRQRRSENSVIAGQARLFKAIMSPGPKHLTRHSRRQLSTLRRFDDHHIVVVAGVPLEAFSPHADFVLVIGAPNSSNSRRLVEVAIRAGAKGATLIQRAGDIDWSLLENVQTLGLSAGASAPEALVEDVVEALRTRYDLKIEEISVTREDVTFNVPRVLAS